MSQPGSCVNGTSVSDDLDDNIDYSIDSNDDNGDDRMSTNGPDKGKPPSVRLDVPPSYPSVNNVIQSSAHLRTRDAILSCSEATRLDSSPSELPLLAYGLRCQKKPSNVNNQF